MCAAHRAEQQLGRGAQRPCSVKRTHTAMRAAVDCTHN